MTFVPLQGNWRRRNKTLAVYRWHDTIHCSVTQSWLALCNPMECSTPGLPVLHHLLKFAQVHVHWTSDAIQSSHPLMPSSPSVLTLSQHQGLFQWVGDLHQGTKILQFQLQPQYSLLYIENPKDATRKFKILTYPGQDAPCFFSMEYQEFCLFSLGSRKVVEFPF